MSSPWLVGLFWGDDTVDGSEIRPSPVDMVKYLIIYRVPYMSGGAGFLPSRV